MAETSPVVAALLVAVAAVGAVPVAALGGGAPAQQPATNDTAANGSLAPGERFAGVVGVQQADVEGEIEARAFGQRVAAAASNRSAAGVVAGEVDDLEARLDELDAEVVALERAHENGTVSEGQYRARLAKLHAKQRAVERRLNQTSAVARGLPAEALEANGVNVTAIRTLRSRAGNLTGPEVAAIARTIAGKNAGKGVGDPPAFVENRTRGPGASDGDRGNGNGPPADAGPGNETTAAGAQGNGNGPPEDTGPDNETGPPEDTGGNEMGPPEDAGRGNETGASEGTGGNETGPSEAGSPSDETGPPENAGANGTEPADARPDRPGDGGVPENGTSAGDGAAGSSGDSGTGGGNGTGAGGDGGNGGGGAGGEAPRSLSADRRR
mgnify:CR=1 FL=1